MQTAMLDSETAAFIQTGVSISLAAGAPGRLPSMSRGLGCRVLDGGRGVLVFIKRSQSAELLANIRDSGRVASVFSLPSDNRTVQLKADDARVLDFDAADLPVIEAHVAAFVDQVLPMGMPAAIVVTMLSHTVDDLVTIAYTPSAAFSQTPGPRAGEPLASAP